MEAHSANLSPETREPLRGGEMALRQEGGRRKIWYKGTTLLILHILFENHAITFSIQNGISLVMFRNI